MIMVNITTAVYSPKFDSFFSSFLADSDIGLELTSLKYFILEFIITDFLLILYSFMLVTGLS